MSVSSDVLSTHLSGAGTITAGRARLKGFSVAPTASTAATFEFRNTSATGTILCQMDVPSNTNPNSFYVAIPQEGILFSSGVYLTFSVGSVAGITAFYG